MSNADLRNAELSEADLTGAELIGADLSGSTLDGARLGAKLSGANLADIEGLTQDQLDGACGDTGTKLPSDLSVVPCSVPAGEPTDGSPDGDGQPSPPAE